MSRKIETIKNELLAVQNERDQLDNKIELLQTELREAEPIADEQMDKIVSDSLNRANARRSVRVVKGDKQ